MDEISHTFRAMNTAVLVAVVAATGEAERARGAAADVEALFRAGESALSRFDPASELSALNRAAGRPFRASPRLFAVVEAALASAAATEGLFDPTILHALVGAGYDRSFEHLAAGAAPVAATGPGRGGGWREVRLDRQRRTIALPAGIGLDLGGIGKGWTVDAVVALLRRRGFASFAVDAGGDLFAAGVQADGSPWTVGVADPADPRRDLLTLAVRDRAVATSTRVHRRWRQGTAERHHLIDPRTGLPAATAVLSATVIASSVARAETLTKAAFLLGPDAGVRWLDLHPDAAGLLVLDDGTLRPSSTLLEGCNAA